MGVVKLMDSNLSSSGIDMDTSLQVAQIYLTHDPTIRKQALSVQKQHGNKDCGIFSIAFAVELCNGNDPEAVYFDQSKICHHLLKCLECKELKPFPKTQRTKKAAFVLKGTCNLNVLCVCKMPEEYDTDMIECVKCNMWHHFECVGMSEDIVPDEWTCCMCEMIFLVFQYLP